MKLVIAPHVDDEVIGCGGILDRDTFVYFCGLQKNHILPANERMLELGNVADFFGFSFTINDKSKVNHYDMHDFINPIEELINNMQPDRIYIPYTSYNQDHQAIYNAAMVALRPQDTNFFVKKVLVYEGIGAFQWYKPDYEVNHFVEISIQAKLKGYSFHASQVRGHRSFEHVEALARLRGSQIGVDFAEAYMVKRWVE
jgi:LmbE family N-acetylglucosaminyl deacetylase